MKKPLPKRAATLIRATQASRRRVAKLLKKAA